MEITVRKIVRQLIETRRENAQPLVRPHRAAIVAAVIDNPYQRGYAQDLLDGLDDAAEQVGQLIGPATVELLDDEVEAFGKAALVGIDGETRSHHQTVTFQIPDAPLPREIVVLCAAVNSGRPLARLAAFGAEVGAS